MAFKELENEIEDGLRKAIDAGIQIGEQKSARQIAQLQAKLDRVLEVLASIATPTESNYGCAQFIAKKAIIEINNESKTDEQ